MHIVILGNGIAGITAARTIRKHSDCRITVISSESEHFFSRTALMYVFMGHQRYEDIKPYEDWFWKKNRIELVHGHVEKVEPPTHRLTFDDGQILHYDRLLLACGSVSKKLGWPGQHLDGVQGLYSLQDLHAMEHYSAGLRRAVIVGGGLIGVEMAEMFHSRHIPVTFLIREKNFWGNVLPPEEARMVTAHLRAHGLDLRLETELKEIWGPQGGRVRAVVTSRGEKIECGFVGLTIGVRPNVDFLHFSGLDLDQGILVNDYLQTSNPHIFAAGDCAQLRTPQAGRRAIEPVWYTARLMGEVAGANLVRSLESRVQSPESGLRTTYSGLQTPDYGLPYRPGLWFNSAKFFDIEYQVYGDVPAQLPDHQDTVFWQHADDQKSVRINWERATGAVTGFLLLGIRYRQVVCEKWMLEKTHIETVLVQLGLANFDPEFFRQYEEEIVAVYNLKKGRNVQSRQRRGLARVLAFLKR